MNSRHFAFDSPVLLVRVCACVSMCMCVRPRTRAHPLIYAPVYYSRLNEIPILDRRYFRSRRNRTDTRALLLSILRQRDQRHPSVTAIFLAPRPIGWNFIGTRTKVTRRIDLDSLSLRTIISQTLIKRGKNRGTGIRSEDRVFTKQPVATSNGF